jgi:hypothetical protein
MIISTSVSTQRSDLSHEWLRLAANIRLSTPFLLLVLHQIIREQLDFRKTLRAAYISDDLDPSKPNPEETNLAMLEELRLQSVDVLLQSCRSQTDMMQVGRPALVRGTGQC